MCWPAEDVCLIKLVRDFEKREKLIMRSVQMGENDHTRRVSPCKAQATCHSVSGQVHV
jgi:hypothetical protein